MLVLEGMPLYTDNTLENVLETGIVEFLGRETNTAVGLVSYGFPAAFAVNYQDVPDGGNPPTRAFTDGSVTYFLDYDKMTITCRDGRAPVDQRFALVNEEDRVVFDGDFYEDVLGEYFEAGFNFE